MSSFRADPFLRLALAAALAASLGLAGCGRKGPLDPPPGASLDGVSQPDMPNLMSSNGTATPIGGQSVDGDTGVDSDGRPRAPKGPQKRIPLDVLLN